MLPLKDTIQRTCTPWMTWLLVFANTLVFISQVSLPDELHEIMLYAFGLVPARYTYAEWAHDTTLLFDHYLSLFTNMFLHGGWLHFIGNMWFLIIFGRTVEDRTGPGRFLVLYLLSGLTGNVLYLALFPASTIPAIGASGAIAGVMGAYLILYPRARILTLIPILFLPLFVEMSAFVFLAYWFFIQLIAGTFSLGLPQLGGVAWFSHVGGFVAGLLLILMLRRERLCHRRQYPDERYSYLTGSEEAM